MLGSQEDVTDVCKSDMSERFLESYEHPSMNEVAPFNIFEIFNAEAEVKPMTTKPETKKAKEPTKQQRIDALLDEINIVNDTQEFLVAEEGYRERRISEIEAKIMEVRAE